MAVTDDDIRRAMRPRNADAVVPAERVPQVLYHVTPISNLDAILGEGLVPRTRNLIEAHPPRVYLCASPASALSLCRQIRSAMVKRGVAKRTWTEDFAILSVDPAVAGVALRVDGSSAREGGVYADAPIPGEAVRHVETVDGPALTSAWWPKVWNHVVWERGGRPPCLVRLGAMAGLPAFEGWRTPEGTTVEPRVVEASAPPTVSFATR